MVGGEDSTGGAWSRQGRMPLGAGTRICHRETPRQRSRESSGCQAKMLQRAAGLASLCLPAPPLRYLSTSVPCFCPRHTLPDSKTAPSLSLTPDLHPVASFSLVPRPVSVITFPNICNPLLLPCHPHSTSATTCSWFSIFSHMDT